MRKFNVISALMFTCFVISSVPTQAQSFSSYSFRSYNAPNRYIRHKNLLSYLEPINDELGRKDATYKLVPGLANSNCKSFESVNFPGHFLRHEGLRLKLARRSNKQLFKEDATFCIVPGLFGNNNSVISFESLNFPGHYIRHRNFELWVEATDGRDIFRKDATFYRTKPLYR